MESDLMTTPTEVSSMLPPATGSSNINVGPAERVASVLLGSAAAIYGLRHINSLGGVALAVAGGLLINRGASGYCMVNHALGRNSANKRTSAMEVSETLTINKPRAEVYAFWRRLENLPQFMTHLKNVSETDLTQSTWEARLPGGIGSVTWEAEVLEDRPGELITWSSLPGSTVDNAGEIRFQDAADGSGTQINARISYRLPAGDVGALAAKLFNPAVETMMKGDLRRFKDILETGAMADVEEQSLVSNSTSKKSRQSRKKNALNEPQDRDTMQTYGDNMLEGD